MKNKQNISQEKLKKLSDAKKNYADILRRITPYLPKQNFVLHRKYSEWDIETTSNTNEKIKKKHNIEKITD